MIEEKRKVKIVITVFVRYRTAQKIEQKMLICHDSSDPLTVTNGWSINVNSVICLKFLLTDGIFAKTDEIFQLKSRK